MVRIIVFAALALALAACGQGATRTEHAASAGACPLLGDTGSLFGQDVEALGDNGFDTMAATCELASADGTRSGDVITYTTASLGDMTLEARLAEVVESWDADTLSDLQPVAGLGDDARLATDLPGYQTQIVFRKGDTLVMVAAHSGDEALSGEALARAMATAVAANIPDAP